MSHSREDLIKWYFSEGYQYRVIVCFLYFVHGIRISLHQLKRELRKMNLRRRVQPSANHISRVETLVLVGNLPFCLLKVLDLYILSQNELQTSGSLLGYRMMWKRLQLKHKIAVSRWVHCLVISGNFESFS